jgi:hypothetical protein
MGGGSYDPIVYRSRAKTYYQSKSREEVFTQKRIDPEMNPKGIRFRESCDSEEHPESFPIIIALDETGSMGHIPEIIIKKILPDIMESIINAGVKDPQVCFMGIGDCCFREEAPLQVGQFESSDELMEKWLTKVYLEGRGGGNMHESYPLAWYFAERHIVTDAWKKRQQKGVLITIGDESCQRILLKEQLERYIDDNPEDDVTASDLLERVREKWNVFHIHCEGGSYRASETNWEKVLGPNLIVSTDKNGMDIKDIIPRIVVGCYRKPEDDE